MAPGLNVMKSFAAPGRAGGDRIDGIRRRGKMLVIDFPSALAADSPDVGRHSPAHGETGRAEGPDLAGP